MLITHENSFLQFIFFYLFLLDYNKVHEKEKFSALDIVESQSKEILLVLHVTSFDIRIIIIILLTNQPQMIRSTACTTKYQVAFASVETTEVSRSFSQ